MLSFVVALIVFPAVGIWLVYRMVARRKRRQAYRAVAEAMGWNYLERDPELIRPFMELPLFGSGQPHTPENVLRGDFGGRPTTVFEFAYTVGSGKSRSTLTQTVVHVRGVALAIPEFELRPESLADRLFSVFGYQDVDIPERPVFSRLFVLRGPDEQAIRTRFSDPVIDAFEATPGVCAQAAGADLFVYRMGRVVNPEALPELLTQASHLMRVFEATQDRSDSGASAPPLVSSTDHTD